MGLDAHTGILLCTDHTEKQTWSNDVEKQHEIYPAVLFSVVCDDAVLESVSYLWNGSEGCGGRPADPPVHGAVLCLLCGVGLHRRMVCFVWKNRIHIDQFSCGKYRFLRHPVCAVPEKCISGEHDLYRDAVWHWHGCASGNIADAVYE